MAKLELLKSKVKELAGRLINECKQQGHQITVTHTLRTIEEQDALYAQGRTKPGNIVTKARGGYSLHNFGVAFDICPIVNGRAAWNDTALFKKIGEIGMKVGLEWGGAWASFPDSPHFQYLAGYSLADFRNNKVDWKKFEPDSVNPISTLPNSQNTLPALKVTAQSGLNVRGGPGTGHAKLGKLTFAETVIPLEKANGWVKIKHGNGFGWVSEGYLA